MMRKKLAFVAVILIFSVFFGLFSKEQALAYWSQSKDGKTQCFAVQYKYASKRENKGKYVDDGNGSATSTTAQLYSTKKICAEVDANGKLNGKISFGGYPDKTSHIAKNDEKLNYKITNEGDTYILKMSTCSTSGLGCMSGKNVTEETYEIKKGDNFESFAKQVFDGAPAKYGISAKTDFKTNETRETVKEEAEGMEPGESSNDDDDGGTIANIKETCANQGGAQSLGWILCPIMELLGEASDNIYEEYVEPALRVDPKLFSDDNQSIRVGWSTFRDIANIIFVILLLIVIFSQLTGVGIDNYGIKKILPKLIVVAVLINLSFVICVLAVDISNILGNSFQALFNELSNTLPTTESIEIAEGSTIDTSGLGGKLASVGILSSAVIAGGMMWANPAIILSLLVSAIGVIISVVFLFIILAVREAAVVVLIVISPVAMVCYMLPNAKKYFDKWFKGFQGLLLVYPICGLLVGGGDYVAKLLLTSGFIQQGFISAFTAMIAGIVPIFFIPMVLKNSFAALGNLGSMISNFGRGMSRGATGRMRGSRGYKNAQEMGYKRQRRINAGLDRSGHLTARGERRARLAGSKLGRFVGADTRLAGNVQAARDDIGRQVTAGAALTGALATSEIGRAPALLSEEDLEAAGLSESSFGEHTEGAYYGRQYMKAAKAGDIKGMDAALQAMNNSGMKPKDIAALVRHVEASGGNGIKDAGQAAEWRSKLFAQYGNGFLATDAELSHYMKTRGAGGGNNGDAAREALGAGYGAYAGGTDVKGNRFMNIDDVRPEDVSNWSSASMAGLASAGLFTQGMAQTVLATNPNVTEDKKIIMSAVANEKIASGASAESIKSDAEALMKLHGAAEQISEKGAEKVKEEYGVELKGGIVGTNATMVDAWTAAAPQNVNVVQNFSAGGKQMQPVDVTIHHAPASGTTSAPKTPPSKPTTNIGGDGGADYVSE